MIRLSVNLNKVALIRNARGANYPDLLKVAKDCESFGAQGITVHPRPDERHVRFSDLEPLKSLVTTEFNIEGYPSKRFMAHMKAVRPHQCTLVPDKPDALTSDGGWNIPEQRSFLEDVVSEIKSYDVRVSLFMDPKPDSMVYAKEVGSDRVELYTGTYAKDFKTSPAEAIENHLACNQVIEEIGIGLNAGHDLDLNNLAYYAQNMSNLQEVSIGHALITDALYYGLENVIPMYRRLLTNS